MKTLGEFGPGDVPVVYDPIYTGNRTPRATLVHEGTHQSLVVNSAYGLFFQVLSKLASRGEHVQEYHLCLSDQWSIQELTATYREMCYVADSQPDQLDEAIRALPTAVLGQPPYRELFDCLSRALLKIGFKGERAALCARLFTDSSLDGIYSHGVNRFPRFLETIGMA